MVVRGMRLAIEVEISSPQTTFSSFTLPELHPQTDRLLCQDAEHPESLRLVDPHIRNSQHPRITYIP